MWALLAWYYDVRRLGCGGVAVPSTNFVVRFGEVFHSVNESSQRNRARFALPARLSRV